MDTSSPTNVAVPPASDSPSPEDLAAAKMEKDLKDIENLRAELKNWQDPRQNFHLVRAKDNQWWKRYDFYGKPLAVDTPKVNTIEEVMAYADQGIPTWLVSGDKTLFGPHALFEMVQEAEDFLRREFEDSVAQEEARNSNRLKSVGDMLKTPEIDWMVEGKIHSKGLCQIFGESYAGKTLLVLDLVMSWCAGLPEWQGYKLNNDGKPQDAVYVAAEGGAALSVHVDAWLKYHPEVKPADLTGLLFLDGGEGDHMFLSIGKTEVDDTESWTRLKQEIITANIAPTVMVFDTQIDLAPGIEENSNTDMVGVLRKVKSLGDQLGFVAIVVHHTGHDGNKARGASGMKGKCDTQAKLTVIGQKSGKAKLEWTKVKGMALPEDTISYEIMGKKQLPDLDSPGAICVPLTKLAAAIALQEVTRPSDDLQRKIMQALTDGELSVRKLSESVDIDRNNKAFKDALSWMTSANYLTQRPEGRSSMVGLAPLAVAPEDPANNS